MEKLLAHDSSAMVYEKIDKLAKALYNYMVSNGITPKSTKLEDLVVAMEDAYPLAKIRKDVMAIANQNEVAVVTDVVKELELIKTEVNGALAKNSIINFVKDNKGVVNGNKLLDAIEGLKTVRTIKPGNKYIAFEVNEAGYITNYFIADAIIDNKQLPEDINRGYYYYEDGKLILDEARKALLWGD